MHDVTAHLTDEQLSTYIDARLDTPEHEAAHSHLQTCADCSQSLQELTFTVQSLRELTAPPLPRSFQIVQEPKTSFWSRLFGSSVALQGLAAAAAGLFVVLLSADMASLTSPARIVPIAPAAQPRAAAPAQNVQATPLPYSAPATASRASESVPAPAAAVVGTPAPPAQTTGAPPQAVARQADSAVEKRSTEASDSARLEALTASEGSAASAAAGAVPRLSLATLAAGLVAVLLIVTAVVRTVRKA